MDAEGDVKKGYGILYGDYMMGVAGILIQNPCFMAYQNSTGPCHGSLVQKPCMLHIWVLWTLIGNIDRSSDGAGASALFQEWAGSYCRFLDNY